MTSLGLLASLGTILVISPSHLPNKTLKKFISKLLVTQYACAKCNITTLLVINSFQLMQYITDTIHNHHGRRLQ